ncbi:hypothetical protein D3C73_1543930 [compost metagenome]
MSVPSNVVPSRWVFDAGTPREVLKIWPTSGSLTMKSMKRAAASLYLVFALATINMAGLRNKPRFSGSSEGTGTSFSSFAPLSVR